MLCERCGGENSHFPGCIRYEAGQGFVGERKTTPFAKPFDGHTFCGWTPPPDHAFDVSPLLKNALDDFYGKANTMFREHQITAFGKYISKQIIKAIFAEMSKCGWAYELIFNQNVEDMRFTLSGYLQWYKNGEKKTQDEFDTEMKEIYYTVFETK